MDYNKLDEEYWKIEKNMVIQSKLFDMSYSKKKQLELEKKINIHDMNEAAKYKLLNGWSYTNEQGIKIVVSPQKYFTNYAWLTELQCQSMGIDWNNVESNIETVVCQTVSVPEKGGTYKHPTNNDSRIIKVDQKISDFYDRLFNREKRKENYDKKVAENKRADLFD